MQAQTLWPKTGRLLDMKINRPGLLAILLLVGLSCSNGQGPETVAAMSNTSTTPPDSLLYQRFPPPKGFERKPIGQSSFGFFLRNLPLKPPGSKVLYYNGAEKENHGVYDAVVDLPIGRKDLHQCADAIIRLRAEYLWRSGQFDQIKFNFTNGFPAEYARWRRGDRIKLDGNKARWVETATASNTYSSFWAYLEMVFSYAGTLSLSKELKPKTPAELQIGDVFIRGGSPGHAVIVVDMAEAGDGRRIFLLAQSYMPAQEAQILRNPSDPKLSPWYSADFGEKLFTPEWTFQRDELKGF